MSLLTSLSFALNALLLVFSMWLACKSPVPESRKDVSPALTNRMLREESHPIPMPADIPHPKVVEIDASIQWAQLESNDYRIYLANLREIGCPELTIQDIIIADVNDLFNGRVKALVDEVTGHFWELILHENEFEKMVNEKYDQLRELRNERDEMIKRLFGNEYSNKEESP